VAKVVTAGLVVGFLTGFFGVGGGFVIVPALMMALGFDMPVAIGTSPLVIAINSAAALAARSGLETFRHRAVHCRGHRRVAGRHGARRQGLQRHADESVRFRETPWARPVSGAS
jgi:predicted anti-sigma-YlaC factor YlaD